MYISALQLHDLVRMTIQETTMTEGKLRPCMPQLSIPPPEQNDWRFFGKALNEYKHVKTTGMCFKCTGNWWSNWELTCGRKKFEGKHPEAMPNKVGALEFPWQPETAATQCELTKCLAMDNLDRIASRAGPD